MLGQTAVSRRPGVTRDVALRRPLAGLLLVYWLVALGIYGVWEERDWYPITGDEPHHIIGARSLLHYGSFEQTQAYEEEFARGFLGQPGDVPDEENAHVAEGPRGRFSVHSPGTGLVALAPITLADFLQYGFDVLFIKTFFVLLSGAAVVAAWYLAKSYLTTRLGRILAVVLTCFSLPLLLAASQVFPDLPGGIVALCVLAWLCHRTTLETVHAWQDIAAMVAISTLPWLHYKFAIVSVVLAFAVLYSVYRSRASWPHLVPMAGVAAIFGGLFFFYHYYAYGDPLATPSEIYYDSRFVMWFFTLSLDRWHGFLIQNPVFFVGIAFLIPFMIRQPLVGVTAFLCFFAVIGINAAHAEPGHSFAGRHAWTGSMVLVPAVIYGLGCIESLSRRLLWGLGGVLVALQAALIAPLLLSRHDLYKQDPETWFDSYRSFYPDIVTGFLPMFYDLDWWYLHPTNYLYIGLVVALAIIGAWTYPRRRHLTLPFGAGVLALTVPALLLAGSLQADPPRDPRSFPARSLHRHFGSVQGEGTLLATVEANEASRWTFGPYIDVTSGDYEVRILFETAAPASVQVGSWDVTGRGGTVRLGGGDLLGTNGRQGVAGDRFTVESDDSGEALEVRLYFDDVADVLLREIQIAPSAP